MKLHIKPLRCHLALGLAAILSLSCLSGCQNSKKLSPSKHEQTTEDSTENLSFEEFTDNLFKETMAANTLTLHYSIEDPASYGIKDYEISLGDFSEEARETSASYLKETLSQVQTFDYNALSLENQLTYDILVDSLNTQIKLCDYDLFLEPLAFSGGMQMELPLLLAEFTFTSEQDVKDYLKLLALVDEYFNQVMVFEREKADNGMFMSAELCESVIESCESFLSEKENHYLLSSFESRLKELNLSEQKNASYIRQNETILEKQLFPSYADMLEVLKELKNSGKNSGGVCFYENGKAYYETLVYSETGCSDSVDVIFERIKNQRLEDLLICASLETKNPTLIEECSHLEWKMSSPENTLKSLETSITEDFPDPPTCDYEINFVEPSLEEYLAPAFYIVAKMDHYKENIIYINERYISSDIYAFTTLAHEGYPGHLYQTVMTYAYDYPNIRSILDYGGYVEGWATYIEMMSYGYAGLDEDVAEFLAHNQAATLSLYASSDIGLHYYGWDDAKMKEFWAGYGITDEAVIKKITQLILSKPGNYLKYYVGYLEFLDLKDYAQDLFGDSYSDKSFHQAILDIGPAPFSILKEYLPKYYLSRNK